MTSTGRKRALYALATMAALAGTTAAAAEITLYSRPGLRGDRRTFRSGERDLGRSGWADRAASVRIDGDSWELCREAEYRECTVFPQGVHELEDTRFFRSLLSLRPLRGRGGDDGTHYTREQARAIAQGLYRALLGRDVDEESLRPAVEEIEQGRLGTQIETILRSSEFRDQSSRLDAEALLEQIYQGLLGRSVDPGGTRTYLARVKGREYAAVVTAILESREYRRRLPR